MGATYWNFGGDYLFQWIFQVPVKGGRVYITPQEAIYKWYISGIYCQLGDYILPTTLYRNLKIPLTVCYVCQSKTPNGVLGTLPVVSSYKARPGVGREKTKWLLVVEASSFLLQPEFLFEPTPPQVSQKGKDNLPTNHSSWANC